MTTATETDVAQISGPQTEEWFVPSGPDPFSSQLDGHSQTGPNPRMSTGLFGRDRPARDSRIWLVEGLIHPGLTCLSAPREFVKQLSSRLAGALLAAPLTISTGMQDARLVPAHAIDPGLRYIAGESLPIASAISRTSHQSLESRAGTARYGDRCSGTSPGLAGW
jgi:hypothetical protein